MTDLMWAAPNGARTLVAPTAGVATFVSAVYGFDTTIVSPMEGEANDGALHLTVADLGLDLTLQAGRGWPIPFRRRPAWFTRYVEAPVARRLLGVRAYGVSPTGVREWYRADRYRPVKEGRAVLHGRDLGAVGPVDPRVGFGFSEPPRRPSLVEVRPLLWDPSGALDRLLPPPHRGPG
jgi:hypothetical protein